MLAAGTGAATITIGKRRRLDMICLLRCGAMRRWNSELTPGRKASGGPCFARVPGSDVIACGAISCEVSGGKGIRPEWPDRVTADTCRKVRSCPGGHLAASRSAVSVDG